MKKLLWLKVVCFFLLLVQCALIAFSVSTIVAGEATSLSYFNIAMNVAFGLLNVKTLAS